MVPAVPLSAAQFTVQRCSHWIRGKKTASTTHTPPGNLRLFRCGKQEKAFSVQFGPYARENYLLGYIAEGSAVFQFSGQTRRVQENTFFVMYPQSGMACQTDPEVPWSTYWVTAGGGQLASYLGQFGLSPDEPFIAIQRPERMLAIFAALFELTGQDSLAHKIECIALMYELLSLLAESRPDTSHSRHIARALDYISQHYAENISVQELADMLHLNYHYFSRLFKKETGVSPVRYLSALRAKKAEHLLRYTNLSLSEISHAVGFRDALYFSRIFKRQTGYSPSAYRELTKI